MELEGIMLSEISQTPYDFTYMRNPMNKINNKIETDS